MLKDALISGGVDGNLNGHVGFGQSYENIAQTNVEHAMKTKLPPQQRLPLLVKIAIRVGVDGIDGDVDLVEKFDETVQNHATFAETRNENQHSHNEPDHKFLRSFH